MGKLSVAFQRTMEQEIQEYDTGHPKFTTSSVLDLLQALIPSPSLDLVSIVCLMFMHAHRRATCTLRSEGMINKYQVSSVSYSGPELNDTFADPTSASLN